MVQSQKITIAPERRLAMTFQMSQALSILQMSNLELKEYIQEEIEKNPLLEEIKPKSNPCIDQEIASQSTTYENLTTQMREIFSEEKDYNLALKIQEFLDEKGFLKPSDEIAQNLGVEKDRIERTIEMLQTLDPPGIFARNLQESLLIQLRAKGVENSTVYTLIQENYDDLLHHRYSLLKKKYKDLASAIQKLALLQLRPLESIKKEIISPIIPDLYIRLTETGWAIGMLDEEIPRFQINTQYQDIQNKEEKKTIDQWISNGKWLVKALKRRKDILLKIALKLTQAQKEYLSQKGNLTPFTVQELAISLNLHESTISRALSQKYVETPLGIILLKSLLTNAPEKKEAKEILRELVSLEDKRAPFTDDQLATALQEKGYKVARRTISKYRKELKIQTAESRKLF